MNCPNCHAHIPDDSPACPDCGQSVIRPRTVIDPEIINDENKEDSHQRENRSFYRHMVFTQSHNNPLLPSCQMSLITIGLAFAMGLSYGVLAFIGFLVFACIARVLTVLINVQAIIMGRPLPPLILQFLSWFCCWALVSWLAS